MKILVVGLCISRNLGGPAMALTLKHELEKRFTEGVDITFAISAIDFVQEKQWADYYGIKIVRRDSALSYLLRKLKMKRLVYKLTGREIDPVYDNAFWNVVYQEYTAACKQSDIIIAMEGISYVGDGTRSPKSAMHEYSSCYFANRYHKPFCRFIQSFGPFNNMIVRYCAQKEFSQLPFIPARGKTSARLCREIVKDKCKVDDYPDIAILLPKASQEWSGNYLKSKRLQEHDYIVVSPSAVIYQMTRIHHGCVGEKYIEGFVYLLEELLHRREHILLLPHMYSDIKEECDREVCHKIVCCLQQKGVPVDLVQIVEEDLDPMQAKALISLSKAAIVSRFHALVAAVSTATPVVTIGWNIKYADLMEYYGISDCAIDIRNIMPLELVKKIMMKLDEYSDQRTNVMRLSHRKAVDKVNMGIEKLVKWMKTNGAN